MNISGIQNGMVGMAIFDSWSKGFEKMIKAEQAKYGDPLIAAAFEAFEQYVATVETQNQAMIEGLATYVMTPKGGVITSDQMAPLLALNILA